MKLDTFTAVTLTAIIGVSAALLSTVLEAKDHERYMHHCSTNRLEPTVVFNGGMPLTKPIVAVQTRRFWPGVNPNIEHEAIGGKRFFQSKFMKNGELKQCFFRNKYWTTKK